MTRTETVLNKAVRQGIILSWYKTPDFAGITIIHKDGSLHRIIAGINSNQLEKAIEERAFEIALRGFREVAEKLKEKLYFTGVNYERSRAI